MINQCVIASAVFFMFGCASVSGSRVAGAGDELVIYRSQRVQPDGGGDSYFYFAKGPDGRGHRYMVLDEEEMYYHGWPASFPGDVVFTVTTHPDHPSLASFYERHHEGRALRPMFFTLGGGDNYMPLRGEIDFGPTSPGIWMKRGNPEGSFSFSVPGGIRTGFVLYPLDRERGLGVCPSGDAFTATMAHGTGYMNPALTVRFVGRTVFHSCRYAIDMDEDTLFPAEHQTAESH